MKIFMGLVFVAVGLFLGIWLGIFVCFIGGIVQIIQSLPHQALNSYVPVNAYGIACGIARVLVSGVVGWLSGLLFVSLGVGLLSD